MRIKNQPARVLFGDTTKHRNFDMAMFAWVGAPENVPRAELNSQQIPTAENGWSGENFDGYSNPEADTLIDAIEVELDPAKRFAMWHQLQTLYAEQLPALPLYFRADAFVLPKWLDGVTPTGHRRALDPVDRKMAPGGAAGPEMKNQRHARTCSGHPRVSRKDVDGRDEPRHDGREF